MMINFKEELDKYYHLQVDSDTINKCEISYKTINNNIDKINKELSCIIINSDDIKKENEVNNKKITEQNKEILSFLEDKWWSTIEKQNSDIVLLKREIKILQDREDRFLKSVIKILDSIEWLNKYIKLFSNDSLESSVNSSMKLINKELFNINITTIGVIGELFNENIHQCIDYVADNNKNQYEIVDVIKRGYMFKGQVLRTAQVVVVNNEEE